MDAKPGPFKLPLQAARFASGSHGYRIIDSENDILIDFLTEAQAALIVEAVNSHAKLLEDKARLVEALEEVCRQYKLVRLAEGYPSGDSISINRAFDALALARED